MLKKPTPADFEISDKRVWHRPTDERFFSASRQIGRSRLEGRLQHSLADYDNDVRQMGRNLWAKHIGSQAGKSAKLTCVG
jgi:hypothetical protein